MLHVKDEIVLSDRTREYTIAVPGSVRRYRVTPYENPSQVHVALSSGDYSSGSIATSVLPFDSGYCELTDPSFFFTSDLDGVRIRLEALILANQDSGGGGGSSTLYQDSIPTVITNDATVGTVPWAAGSGSTIAYVYTGTRYPLEGETSEYLMFSGFSFTIPVGATIVGIQDTIWGVDLILPGDPANFAYVEDNSFKFVKAGAIVGAEIPRTGGSQTPITKWKTETLDEYNSSGGGSALGPNEKMIWGSATELGGVVWTPAQVNAANFGGVLSVVLPTVTPDTNKRRPLITTLVGATMNKYISRRVYYTP